MSVLAILEHQGGALHRMSFETLAAAQELAAALGTDVEAALATGARAIAVATGSYQVEQLAAAGADVIMMNMQYSPRTESMLGVAPFADVMRWVAEQRSAVLFDRLAIMHYWSDAGTFNLYTATKKYDMAHRVHDCIGWALASQIVAAAHFDAARMQTTR